ncbi:hypothetical protein [Gilvimarinus japonicus]|uniref:Uncharacterized protein n=1 Tax=Gilvimarinus japonicus TaxID=1796469 RepID=A0ABV7HK65_9GAMM
MKNAVTILLTIFSLANCIIATAESKDKTWEDVQIQVASITDINDQFYKSINIFTAERYPYQGSGCKVINGDSIDEIQGSEVVHIKGNLRSDIILDAHSELVVGKDVMPGVKIHVNGLARIFVGGDFKGKIIAQSSYSLHVMGSQVGVLTTGSPSTNVIVHGDFSGKMYPNEGDGSLASLQVYGFTDIAVIKNIFSRKYTQLNGAFYNSNVEPGIYQASRDSLALYTVVNRKK